MLEREFISPEHYNFSSDKPPEDTTADLPPVIDSETNPSPFTDKYLNEGEKGWEITEAKQVITDLRKIVEECQTPEVQEEVQKIVDKVSQNPLVMDHLVRLAGYDQTTYNHCLRVGVSAAELSTLEKIDASPEEMEDVLISGLLHDIGKCNIPHHIVDSPNKLSPQELIIMQKHVAKGIRMLPEENFEVINRIIGGHHFWREEDKRYGYDPAKPNDEHSEYVTRLSQILSLADIWDALLNSRSYKGKWDINKSIEIIQEDFEGDETIRDNVLNFLPNKRKPSPENMAQAA